MNQMLPIVKMNHYTYKVKLGDGNIRKFRYRTHPIMEVTERYGVPHAVVALDCQPTFWEWLVQAVKRLFSR